MRHTIIIPSVLLVAYFLILIFLTLRSSRNESTSEYMIGARKVGVLATVASIAGNLRDGAGLAAWVSLGYFFGFGALWLTTGLAAALLLMAYYAPRIREDAAANDYISVTELLAKRVGSRTARLSVFIISITALLYAAAQVYVAGRLFAGIYGSSPAVGIAITALIVGAYLAIGGYAATILTGIIQWAIIMLIVILPFFFFGGVPRVEASTLFSPDLLTGFGFFGISFLVCFCSADLWQLIFSASSQRTAKRSFALSVPVYYLISIGMIFFAVGVRSVVGTDISPSEAFFQLFSTPSIAPVLTGILGVFVLAAVMSTLDSQVFLFTSTLIRTILPESITTNDARMRGMTRVAIISTMIVLALIAAGIGNIVEFLFGAVTLSTVLMPILLLTLLFKKKYSVRQDLGITIALLIASVAYAYMFYAGWFKDISLTLLPAAISTVLCLVAITLIPKESRVKS
jgi:solute:Na+ symporter, SSS family